CAIRDYSAAPAGCWSVDTSARGTTVSTQCRPGTVRQYTEPPLDCPSVHRDGPWPVRQYIRTPKACPSVHGDARGLSVSTQRRPVACPSVHTNGRGLSFSTQRCATTVDRYSEPPAGSPTIHIDVRGLFV